MADFVTVYAEGPPLVQLAPWAWAAVGAGLLALGGVALWSMRWRDWGVAQFVAGVAALLGAVLLFHLALPPGEGEVLQGTVSGYERRGGSACFVVQGESVCAGAMVPVRDGQLVRVLRVDRTPVRIAVDRTSRMPEAEVAQREWDARRRADPALRGVSLGMYVIATGLFGWLAGSSRRAGLPRGRLGRMLFRGLAGMVAVSTALQFAGELRAHALTADVAGPAIVTLASMGALLALGGRRVFRSEEENRV